MNLITVIKRERIEKVQLYLFALTPSKVIALLMWTVLKSPNGVHNREVLL